MIENPTWSPYVLMVFLVGLPALTGIFLIVTTVLGIGGSG
jgi:hypothetical protein